MMSLVSDIFLKLLNMGNSAAATILIILGLRILLAKVPKRIILILWSVAAVKLVFPLRWFSCISKEESDTVGESTYVLSQYKISFSYNSIASGYFEIPEKMCTHSRIYLDGRDDGSSYLYCSEKLEAEQKTDGISIIC